MQEIEKILILLFVVAKVSSGSFVCIEFQTKGDKFVVDKGSNVTIAFNISRECPPLLFITVFNRKGHQFEEYCVFMHKDGQCSSSSPSECICEHLQPGPQYVISGNVSEEENVGMEWLIAGTNQSDKYIFKSHVNVTVRPEDTTTDKSYLQQSTSTQTSSSSTKDTVSSVKYATLGPDSLLEEDKEGTTENPVTVSVVTKAIVESETLDHTMVLYTFMGVIVLLVVVVLVVFGIVLYRKVLSVNHKLKASNRAHEEPVREQVEMMELPPQPMGNQNQAGVGNRVSAFSIASDVYQTIEDSSTTDDNSQVGWSGTEFDSDPDDTLPVVASASAKLHVQETSYENDPKECARGNKGAKRAFENFSRDPTYNNESKELAYEIKDLLGREGEHAFDRGRRGIVFENELSSSSVDGVDVRPVGLRIVHHCKPPSGLPFDLGASTSDYLHSTVSKVEKQASDMLKTEGAKHQAVLQEDQEISALTLNAGASSSDYLHPTFSKKEKQGRSARLKNPVVSQEDREIKAFALKSGGNASSQRVGGREGISVAHPQYIPHPRPGTVAEKKKANVRYKLWTSTNPCVRGEGVGGVSMDYNPRQYPFQTRVSPSLSRSADNLLFPARPSAAAFAREFTHDTPLTYPNVHDINTSSRLDRYERKSLTSSVPDLPTDSDGYLMPRQLFATPPRKPRALVIMNKKSALQDASTNIAHKGLSLGVHKFSLDHPAKSQGPSKPPPPVRNKPQKFAVRSDPADRYRSSQPRLDEASASSNLSFNRKVQQERLSKQTEGGVDAGHGASKQVENEYMNDELEETSEETADGYMRMNRLRVSVDIHKPYHCQSTDLEQQELDLALQTDPNTIHADHGVDSTPVESVAVFGEASLPHASVDQPYQNIDNL